MPTPIQTTSPSTGYGASRSVSLSSSPAIGNVVIIEGFWSHSFGTTPTSITFSDNQTGNTWSGVTYVGPQNSGVFFGFGVINSSTTGTFTVTCNGGAGADLAWNIAAAEFPDLDIADLLDQQGSASIESGNNYTVSASSVNTGADRLVLAAACPRGGGSWPTGVEPPSTGYTSLFASTSGDFQGAAAYKTVSSLETSSVAWGALSTGGGQGAILLATLKVGGGGGGVTGSLAVSETGADTIAASGNVIVQGALASDEAGGDTSAMAGTVLVSGALSAAEAGSDTASLAGVVLVSGSLSAAETGSDTAALSGLVLVQGSLAVTESGPDTFAATGSLSGGINGSLNAAESGSDSFAATGNVPVAGSFSATESGPDSAAVAGVVLVQGALSVAESGSDTFSAQGIATAITGYLNAQESGSDTAQILGDGVSPEVGRLGGFAIDYTDSALWWKRKPKTVPAAVAEKRIKRVAKAIAQIAAQKVEQDEPIKQRDVRAEIAPLLAEMPGFDWRPLFRAIVEFRQAEAARLEAVAQIERIRAIESDDEDVLVLLMSF